MISQGVGLIEWVAIGGEPKRGWGETGWGVTVGLTGIPESSWGEDTFSAGDVAQLWLSNGYARLDQSYDDSVSVSETVAGVSETLWFSSVEKYKFELKNITDIRGLTVASDYDAFMGFSNSAIRGLDFLWYPDFTNYPEEFFTCKFTKKRRFPRRNSTNKFFSFRFEVDVPPAVQFPSNIPSLA